MTVAELVALLDGVAPLDLAEGWDNVGLLVGRAGRQVELALAALELRAEVMQQAIDGGAHAIVVHHPPLFPAVSRITDESTLGTLLLDAARADIALIALHTNLDSAAGGLNDIAADLLGIGSPEPLVPADDPAVGMGRVGDVDPTRLGAFAGRVADVIPGPVTVAGPTDAPVVRVAVCTGSGGSLIDAARAAGADVYVTGDLKHHDHDRAEGMALIDTSHAQLEQLTMRRWFEGIAPRLAEAGVEARFSDIDTDPWRPATAR